MIPAAARVLARLRSGLPRRAARTGVAAVVTAGVTALLVGSVPGPAAAHQAGPPAAAAAKRPPLAVSVETMTPSTVPRRGTVTLSGEIHNRSRSTWTDLQVFLFASDTPITTPDGLAEATATDETLEVGSRITAPGRYDEVPDLEPGQTTSYELSVPVSELPFTDPGVYWVGVHVLGTNEEGRLSGADGRARTFIPLMPDRSEGTTLSLVMPLRAPVRRTADGAVANPAAWARRLGQDGRLGRLTGLGETAFDVPLTWVVDPAVLDAARSLADGNPGFDLGPTDGRQRPSGSPSPDSPLTESPGTGDSGDSGTSEAPEEELGELTEEAQAAEQWLSGFVDDAAEHEVHALPYGDVDVAALLRGRFGESLRRSSDLGVRTMERLGLDADPVVAPIDGRLPNAGIDELDPEVPLLLSASAARTDRSEVTLPGGPEALLSSDVARVGGPTPTPPFEALALRQRILAEAAVHGIAYGPDRPLVVPLPDLWDPGRGWRSAGFFAGLDVPWLRAVRLSTARAMAEAAPYDAPLVYRRPDRRAELPLSNLLATEELAASGDVLAALLTQNDTIDEQVAAAAMLGSSVHARRHPDRARAATRRISRQVHGDLSKVYVEGSELVTMSSESGYLTVTVVNNLEEPVTAGLSAETGTDDLTVRTPDLVSLGPGQRATVRLVVRARDIGVHSVRLVPTTEDGRPLGRSTVIKVRSSQVGLVIWVVMATGGIVFVAAIVTRIVRRVRARRRAPEPSTKDVTS